MRERDEPTDRMRKREINWEKEGERGRKERAGIDRKRES